MSHLKRAAARTIALALIIGCGDDTAEGRRGDAAAAPAERACGVAEGPVQIAQAFDVLRPGASVTEVLASCPVVGDTVVPGAEGSRVRLLSIAFARDTVDAEVVADTVWRLRLTSDRYRSADGVGVGSLARDIGRVPGARVVLGEGEVYMTIDGRCGVSYRLGGVEFGRMASARGDAAVAALPESAYVDRVLVWQCADGAREWR